MRFRSTTMSVCMRLAKFILCNHNIIHNEEFECFLNFCRFFHLFFLSAHVNPYFFENFCKKMGGTNIAAHALVRSRKSALKRGKTYLFDAMNVLYSMCNISAIFDLIAQKPSIPTRQIVSYLCWLCFLLRLTCVCMLIKVFTYLDKWSRAHNFEGNNGKKMDPVYLIFVVDGRIDPCKKSRNNKHEMKKKS